MRHIITVLLLLYILPTHALAKEEIVPRKIIALYDSEKEDGQMFSRIHTLADMPLNHLGLVLEYHDIGNSLPDLTGRKDVRGILTWLPPGAKLKEPEKFLKWAIAAIDAGKKFVVMGDIGLGEVKDKKHGSTSILVNRFMRKLGLYYNNKWINITYDVEFTHKNPEVVDFERKMKGVIPAFVQIQAIDNKVVSHLTARKKNRPDTKTQLVVTGPSGGFIAEGFAYYSSFNDRADHEIRQWYINPFEFFRLAFATDDLPKPDTTTIAGRRIYYSHIDGDGWTSITQIEKYRRKPVMSARVVMERAILPYSDFPVSVAPIAADLDISWVGSNKSRSVARELFQLPQVEIGSHTYSHPFYWKFFEDGNTQKEEAFLDKYSQTTWSSDEKSSWVSLAFLNKKSKASTEILPIHYNIPRAYARLPFDAKMEVQGSIDLIESLAPSGKKMKILQWSGDTAPFEEAIALTREAGVRNINGGDSRFDREFPSYAWVSPVGRVVGKQRQIYSSNSNENTYTDLWTGRFYGFKYLKATLENTESPIRIKPLNVYYHMYSGEKQASLYALLSNLEYARTQELAPITASNYAAIGDGFFDTEITKGGKDEWIFRNRDGLQTIRFDNKPGYAVDVSSSKGVVGQRRDRGNLYVYLDENSEMAKISIVENENGTDEVPESSSYYLIEGRWKIWNLTRKRKEFIFTAQGYGGGDMRWQVPSDGEFSVIADGKEIAKFKSKNRVVDIKLDNIAIEPIQITIKKK